MTFVGVGVVVLASPEIAGIANTFRGVNVIPHNEVQPPGVVLFY